MRFSLGWRILLDLLNHTPIALENAKRILKRKRYIPIAPQDAKCILRCNAFRDGDFQGDNRDSPLEWRGKSHAFARHVSGIPLAKKLKVRILKGERYRSLKYFISNSAKVLLTGLTCQTLFGRVLAVPVASDNITALNAHSADNSSAMPAVAWIENSIKPEFFTQLIQNVPHFKPINEKFDDDAASRPGSRVKRASDAERRYKRLVSIRSNLINNDVCLSLISSEALSTVRLPFLSELWSLNVMDVRFFSEYWPSSVSKESTPNFPIEDYEHEVRISRFEKSENVRWAFKVFEDDNMTFSIKNVDTKKYLCPGSYDNAFSKTKVKLKDALDNGCLWNILIYAGETLSISLQDAYARILGVDDSAVDGRRPAYVKRNGGGSRWHVKMCNPEDLENTQDIKSLNDLRGLGNLEVANLPIVLPNKSKNCGFRMGTISYFSATALICYFLVMYILVYRKVYKDEKNRLKIQANCRMKKIMQSLMGN